MKPCFVQRLKAEQMRKLNRQETDGGLSFCHWVFFLWLIVRGSAATAADNVAGNLINFDNDGMWSWYMDERVIVDPTNGTLVISSNSSSPVRYPTGRPTGSEDVFTYDFATGNRTRFQLADIEEDDHNSGGLLILPSGQYLTMYSNHGNTGGLGDEFTQWRVSNNAHDSTSWAAQKTFNWNNAVDNPGRDPGGGDLNNVSYHNIFHLAGDVENLSDDRIFNFSRATGQAPNILEYNPAADTMTWRGQLLTNTVGGYSTGYLKYASNDADKIYFITTETHPRNYNNSIYAGYLGIDGKSYRMDGTEVDSNSFDNAFIGGTVPDGTSFTVVQQADDLGFGFNRLWTVDTALDTNENLLAMYVSRWDNDGVASPGGDTNLIDHRIHFARWDGTQWHNHQLAQMGDRLYGSEQDYTGNGALVPGDPNTVYISTQYDPRQFDPQNPKTTPDTTFREIYKGVTSDGGASWNWTAITSGSTSHNLRPLVPEWDADHTAVVWFRGTYTSAQNTDTAVVGILEQNDTQTGLVHYVDASTGNTVRSDGSALAATGPSAAEGNADSNWHWRTGTGNNSDVLASGGSAAENAPALRTTLSGLSDGAYDIFAYFWANPAQDWRIQAGFAANDLQLYRDNGAQQAEASQFDPLDPSVVLSGVSSSALYRLFVGRTAVSGGSAVNVFVDDFSANTTTRTWYDGLGYALVTDVIQGLAGDFNGDMVVDAADYTSWRDHLGTNFGLNGNGDEIGGSAGLVDQADYDLWKINFGNSLPGSGGGARSAVPEPSIGFLLGLAAVLVRPLRSRRFGNP
jgi:hypothetical protein